MMRRPSSRLACSLAVLCGSGTAYPTRPARVIGPVSTISRRTVAAALLPLCSLPLLPARGNAVCRCQGGVNNCVCDDEPGSVDSIGGVRKAKRVDAKGRDVAQSQKEIKILRAEFEELESPGRVKRARPESRQKAAAQAAPAEDRGLGYDSGVRTDFVGLSGGGSQNYGEIQASEARERFQEILYSTVEKQEAFLGFKLKEEEIEGLAKVLRNKYCGPAGLIGPC